MRPFVPDLSYIIENKLYRSQRFIDAQDFISYCKKRGVETSLPQLEHFEELGLFYPMIRVERPLIKIKTRRLPNGESEVLGVLEDGEQWSGDFIRQYAHFSFYEDQPLAWFQDGLLWDPSTRPYRPWSEFKGEPGGKIISYYSAFQVYPLFNLLQGTQFRKIRAEQWVLRSEEELSQTVKLLLQEAHMRVTRYQQDEITGERAAYVAQVISNRYYYETQTDKRTITTGGWEWEEYTDYWNAKEVLADLGMEVGQIKEQFEQASRNAHDTDPLENWKDLVDFVSLDKRKRLKGSALLAQEIYSIASMLSMFYKDLTGEQLRDPRGWPDWTPDKIYGEGVSENELLYLEFLTNEYSLNPRPRLILVVEGEGEAIHLPKLCHDLLGFSFPTLGIEVMKLGGIANFTGGKRDRYGALTKLIDSYHSRQTIVFVILDNEGGVAKVRRHILSTNSIFNPARKVTKEEYIHLWEKNIEFDNFTDLEIANALTEVGQGRYTFNIADVARCRLQFGSGGDPLSSLFAEKIGNYQLNKTELLGKLFDLMIANPTVEVLDDEELLQGKSERPITQVLQTLIGLAAGNEPPTTLESYELNQESGIFGDLA